MIKVQWNDFARRRNLKLENFVQLVILDNADSQLCWLLKVIVNLAGMSVGSFT